MNQNRSFYCYSLMEGCDPEIYRFAERAPRDGFAEANGFKPCIGAVLSGVTGIPGSAFLMVANPLWDTVETSHGPARRFNWPRYRDCLERG